MLVAAAPGDVFDCIWFVESAVLVEIRLCSRPLFPLRTLVRDPVGALTCHLSLHGLHLGSFLLFCRGNPRRFSAGAELLFNFAGPGGKVALRTQRGLELMLAFSAVACFAVLVLFVYGIRHLLFTASRLFEEPQTNYADLAGFHIPSVSILIPMHNEAAVARDLLNALAAADYPHEMDRFEVIPIDDHSDDDTGKILEAYAARYDWIKPIYRRAGKRGKPAALEVATRVAKGEILVLFDADYVPGKSFLKFIAAPFSNPEV